MPSLFSRSRTTSTPHNTQPFNRTNTASPDSPRSLDEFGRAQSRASNNRAGGGGTGFGIGSPLKKEKKRAKEAAKRAKALGVKPDHLDPDADPPTLPDGSFLPLNLEPSTHFQGPNQPTTRDLTTDYGYLSYERHVVLGLEQLELLVSVVAEELETRGGITTPFIFSTTALDISASAIKRLIRSFLSMCAAQGSLGGGDATRAWREEARFAGPHELGMCLRWGLARVVRVSGGMDVRGLVSWDIYSKFRDSEAANGYPPAHFEIFLDQLEPTLQSIVIRVLSLLTRLTANSTSSGHTPPTLSPLFGPLLFGLGPATLSFHHTYIHYLRAVNATEHIVLAFIRWQDSPRLPSSSSAATLGVPIRLKEWIKGYPSMLPFLHEPQKNVKPRPRKGAKTLTLTSVRRNVRMYSPDLVKTAATWAHRAKSSNGVINGLANSKEWERIAPATLKLPPKYSENYKKRMNMPPDAHPETAPGMAYSRSNPSSRVGAAGIGGVGVGGGGTASTLASTLSIGTVTGRPISQSTSMGGADRDYPGLGGREGEDRFRSLTDLKWGQFESMGFSNIGDDKKLQFDLTEGAREERAAKRQTMSWNDFSASGFTRTDAPLNATLQFSTPLSSSVTNWPAKDAALTKKLKKTEKQLPPFGWDTEPVMGGEEVVEEAFVDVFCDLIYGGGWMDLERGESLDRDVNWALVEFKSLSSTRPTAVLSSSHNNASSSDPRTSATLILFEEFVPVEYRQQLLIKSTTRRRLVPALLFSPSAKSKKQWKQAATLNGRPYVVGHVPRSPSYREMEFEGLLLQEGGSATTKVISLGSKASTRVVSSISTATTGVQGHGKGGGEDGPLPPVPPLPAQFTGPLTPVRYPKLHAPVLSGPSASAPSPRHVVGLPSTPRPHKSDEFHSTTPESVTPMSQPSFSTTTKNKPSSSFSIGHGHGGGGGVGGGIGGGGVATPTSRFKITNVIPVPSPKRMSQLMMHSPSEYSHVEFETRLASYSGSEGRGSIDDELDDGQRRKEDDENAWVDILVNSHTRRLGGQDAELGMKTKNKNGLPSSSGAMGGAGVAPAVATAIGRGAIDPDLASLEVAQVLAAVRSHRNMSSSDLGSISTGDHRQLGERVQEREEAREHGPSVDMDAHVQGLEIDEIERVPRLPRIGGSSSGRDGPVGGRARGKSESESSTGHGLAYDDDDEEEDDEEEEGDRDGEDGDDEDDEDDVERSQDLSSFGHGHAQKEQQLQQEEEAVLPVRHALRQQRRLGYFDMHPDRKQLYSPSLSSTVAAVGASSGRQSPPLPPPPLDLNTQQQRGEIQYGSPSPSYDSSFRVGTEMVETAGVSLLPSLGSKRERERETGYTQPTTTTTTMKISTPTPMLPPMTPPVAHPIGPRAPASASPGGGGASVGASATTGAGAGTKTAALIEMYRKREREATTSSPSPSTTTITSSPSPQPVAIVSTPTTPVAAALVQPSSIPVAVSSVAPLRVPLRSASLPGATNPNTPLGSSTISSSSSSATSTSPPIAQRTLIPIPVATAPVVVELTPATPTPPGTMDVVEDVDAVESPPQIRPAFEETGRASPARYVHGAPLHNVIEEEEEE